MSLVGAVSETSPRQNCLHYCFLLYSCLCLALKANSLTLYSDTLFQTELECLTHSSFPGTVSFCLRLTFYFNIEIPMFLEHPKKSEWLATLSEVQYKERVWG